MTYNTHLLRHLRFTIGQNIHRHRSQQKLPLRNRCDVGSYLARLPQCHRLS